MKHFLLGLFLILLASCASAQQNRELVLQLPHRERVLAVAPSPDGSCFASAANNSPDELGGDGEVKMWTRQGELLRTLRSTQTSSVAWVNCLAWRDADTLVTGDSRGLIQLWSKRSGRCLGSLRAVSPNVSTSVRGIIASHDGGVLVAAISGEKKATGGNKRPEFYFGLAVWRGKLHYKLWKSIRLAHEPNDIQWAAEGISILLSHEGGSCTLNLATGQQSKQGKFTTVASAPGVETTAGVNESGISILRPHHTQITTRVLIKGHDEYPSTYVRAPINSIGYSSITIPWNHQQQGDIASLALSPDGSNLVAAIDGISGDPRLVWFNAQTGSHLGSTPIAGDTPNSLAFFPDGKTLISGEDRHHLELWDTRKRKPIKVMASAVDSVGLPVFSPDGHLLVSGNEDGTLRFWDVFNKRLLKTLDVHTGWISTLAFSRDGKKLASIGQDGKVQIWDVRTFKRLAAWSDDAQHCAFSADGNQLIVMNGEEGDSPRELRVWNANTGQLEGAVTGHGKRIGAIALSPDGQRLASGAEDGTIKIWNLSTLSCELTLRSSTLEIIDGDVLSLRGPRVWTTALAWSLDGERLVVGNSDGTVRLWNWKNHQTELTLPTPLGSLAVETLQFTSPNTLLAAHASGRLFQWDIATGKLKKTTFATAPKEKAVDEFETGAWPYWASWANTISSNGRYAATVSRDGGITLAEVASGRPLATFLVLPAPLAANRNEVPPVSSQWIAYTPAGKINSSPGAKKFIRWRVSGKLLPASP